jgi:two-component system CheB/CheR fusion protein
MEAILSSLSAGVAVVNRDLQVQIWNRRAEDLWGLRRDEAVGEHFLNLDFGLPIEQLRPVIRHALNGGPAQQEIFPPAVNRRGRSIMVRVTCSPLVGADDVPKGAIMVMEPDVNGGATG